MIKKNYSNVLSQVFVRNVVLTNKNVFFFIFLLTPWYSPQYSFTPWSFDFYSLSWIYSSNEQNMFWFMAWFASQASALTGKREQQREEQQTVWVEPGVESHSLLFSLHSSKISAIGVNYCFQLLKHPFFNLCFSWTQLLPTVNSPPLY